MITGSRIPTVEVAERFKAGESLKDLSADFRRPIEEIEEAVPHSNSTSKPPDPPLVFFIDECLGTSKVPAALVTAGAEAKTLTDVFAQGVKDVDWLKALQDRDWIVITKDKNIRRRPLEAQALIAAGLRVFVITATDLTGEEAGQVT